MIQSEARPAALCLSACCGCLINTYDRYCLGSKQQIHVILLTLQRMQVHSMQRLHGQQQIPQAGWQWAHHAHIAVMLVTEEI